MFNFGKKQEKDPQKALDNAKKTLNNGLMGGMTKAFMGKDFVNDMNASIDQGQSALDGVNQQQWLAQSGLDATAEVMAIVDTGTLVNMNPVVMLTVKIQPSFGGVAFETTGKTMVSKIAIPRVGDKVKIKYNPADPTQFVVM